MGVDNIDRFGVRTVISLSEAKQRRFKLVYAKWLDEIKTLDGDPRKTSGIKFSRLILFLASSRMDSSGQHDRLVVRYDARVALFNVLASGKISVIPP